SLGADIMGVDLGQRIGGEIAEEGSTSAQAGDAGGSVAGAASGGLDGRAHAGIEELGTLGIDKVHRPLDDAVFLQKSLVASGDDVHNGIADAKHVEFAHSFLR